MANPINNVQVALHNHTYDKLLQLKQKKGYTFDELVNELIEYDMQTNYITRVQEYCLVTPDKETFFKVTFKKESMIFEFFNGIKYSNDIRDLDVGIMTIKVFNEFIHKDYARVMLENVDVALVFEDFVIEKIRQTIRLQYIIEYAYIIL